ncbi:MAG: ferritin [Sedimentisphaerales bacterium]|nr:ferritin [Sedimentisphaerales bacterium]
MIGKKMEKALNGQINAELYSAYLYLSMAAWFESKNLPGFANWMRIQFQEEQFHAMKFYDYILERGGTVTLSAIEAPQTTWKSPLDAFESTLEHEQKVTGLINDLVYLARDEKDNASEIFLQWFVTEQVEEEDNVNTILGQLEWIKDHPQALFGLNKELGQRTFTPPATEGD